MHAELTGATEYLAEDDAHALLIAQTSSSRWAGMTIASALSTKLQSPSIPG